MCPQTTRRYRTAKKIQATAIDLAVRDGLANVTTDAIARAAGISTRSFFNYYPYKEAAIMGPPPDYPADAIEQFVAAKGALIDDLNRMITAHLIRFVDDRQMMAHVWPCPIPTRNLRRCATASFWPVVRRCAKCCNAA